MGRDIEQRQAGRRAVSRGLRHRVNAIDCSDLLFGLSDPGDCRSSGSAYHFWPSGTKPLVASSGLRTVLLAFEAKQISASGANIDDEVGTIVAAAGFDWWPSPGATTGNSEAVHGSFKAVNTSWRSFYVTTARTALMLDCPLFPALAQLTQTGEPGVDPDFVAP